ncbi:Yip1 family protein [Candidatus Sororendozoicomonas aggregata]|uniref:Yip1 family protein n=1 Tax=Candidatus Sororendozoicomonas aggregata TaxID=3073239 RepID=UPI002ED2046D
MMFTHVWGLMTKPEQAWSVLRDTPPRILSLYLGRVIWLAAIPALCTYYGTTTVGWQLPGSDMVTRLSQDSARSMAILAWLAMLAGIAIMGWAIQWMSQTFNTKTDLSHCITFSSYAALPLFFAGICGLYPSLWLLMSVSILAASVSAWLLYTGLPIYMGIPREQGFLYASSILCIGLVVLVSLMIITVIFWGMGVGPEYVQGS